MRQPRRRVSDRDAMLRGVSEREFQAGIIDAAAYLGWLVFHTFDSRMCEPGYPDLTLVHPVQRRLVYMELKTETGTVSSAQLRWLAALMVIPGIEVHTVRPRDMDRVLEILQPPIPI